MTIRELRQKLFEIEEQDAEIVELKFSECSPELIITAENETNTLIYKINL
jgi:hypothetical protein